MPRSSGRRREPPGESKSADRAFILTVLTVAINAAGQVVQAWVKGVGRS